MGGLLTPAAAFRVQAAVVQRIAGQRAHWVPLAGSLHEFHEGRGWEALGMDSFNEWLGQPEVGLGRAHAYALISAYRVLVVGKEVDPAVLEGLDVTKIQVVLPAVRRGDADVLVALADVEALSRSDLKEAYGHAGAASYRVCEACGSRIRITAGEGA